MYRTLAESPPLIVPPSLSLLSSCPFSTGKNMLTFPSYPFSSSSISHPFFAQKNMLVMRSHRDAIFPEFTQQDAPRFNAPPRRQRIVPRVCAARYGCNDAASTLRCGREMGAAEEQQDVWAYDTSEPHLIIIPAIMLILDYDKSLFMLLQF
ncbi:hypothetical protein SEVIR_4G155900v4 [Setaria viridis]|uniref:Uncharacterized protein n=1 Tax=Setaria viridis TaxID=4556 RepID=A0A4U6V3J8_SETVI|nr:hypothetical protein SEVIR_4G155900v2 [Setaria viridis]